MTTEIEITVDKAPAKSPKYYTRNGQMYFRLMSGKELLVTPVSPLLIEHVVSELVRKPEPPVQMMADGAGGFYPVTNEDHPDYAKAIAEYERTRFLASQKALLQLGVSVDIGPEEKKAVDRLRDHYRRIFKQELDPDDEYVYIAYCLIQAQEDLAEIGSVLSGTVYPSEEMIAQAIESFPGRVARG